MCSLIYIAGLFCNQISIDRRNALKIDNKLNNCALNAYIIQYNWSFILYKWPKIVGPLCTNIIGKKIVCLVLKE